MELPQLIGAENSSSTCWKLQGFPKSSSEKSALMWPWRCSASLTPAPQQLLMMSLLNDVSRHACAAVRESQFAACIQSDQGQLLQSILPHLNIALLLEDADCSPNGTACLYVWGPHSTQRFCSAYHLHGWHFQMPWQASCSILATPFTFTLSVSTHAERFLAACFIACICILVRTWIVGI